MAGSAGGRAENPSRPQIMIRQSFRHVRRVAESSAGHGAVMIPERRVIPRGLCVTQHQNFFVHSFPDSNCSFCRSAFQNLQVYMIEYRAIKINLSEYPTYFSNFSTVNGR